MSVLLNSFFNKKRQKCLDIIDILYASAVRAAALFALQKDVALSYLKVYCVFSSFSLLLCGSSFQFSDMMTGMCSDMFWHEVFKMLSGCITAKKP